MRSELFRQLVEIGSAIRMKPDLSTSPTTLTPIDVSRAIDWLLDVADDDDDDLAVPISRVWQACDRSCRNSPAQKCCPVARRTRFEMRGQPRHAAPPAPPVRFLYRGMRGSDERGVQINVRRMDRLDPEATLAGRSRQPGGRSSAEPARPGARS